MGLLQKQPMSTTFKPTLQSYASTFNCYTRKYLLSIKKNQKEIRFKKNPRAEPVAVVYSLSPGPGEAETWGALGLAGHPSIQLVRSRFRERPWIQA